MKIYVVTIEQTYVTEEGQKVLKEYMTNTPFDDVDSAEVKYFNRCAELKNAIGKTHEYAAIKMTTSAFGEYEKREEEFGAYKEIPKNTQNASA